MLGLILISTLVMTIETSGWKHERNVLKYHSTKYQSPKYPFKDPSLPWDARVDDLISRLTLQEIAAQTMVVYPGYQPPIPRLGIKPYVWDTECLHGQVHTNSTAFPQSLGLAATFRS